MSKITLPIAELKPALAGLGKIVSKRSTLPVLTHLKIERTSEGWIVLTGTDLDHFASVRAEQPAKGEPIQLLVPYDELQKITKNCAKADQLLVSTAENASGASVIIEYAVGNQIAEARLQSLPVDEFPPIPRIEGKPVPLDEPMRQTIREALDCASTDETRLILNGAFIDVSRTEGHYVVGTNGSHLFASNSFKLPLKESLVLPSHKFLEFREFNHDGDWQLSASIPDPKNNDGWIQLSSRRWTFLMRQIEGTFPNWRQVVPKDFKSSIELADPESLADTIERLPDHNERDHTIGLERKEGALNLLWKSSSAEEWKRLPITASASSGNFITIYVNRLYLIKALRFGLNKIELIDPMSPLRFSHEGKQMIVMPLRDSARITPASAPVNSNQPAAQGDAAPQKEGNSMPEKPNTSSVDAQLDQCIEELETLKEAAQEQVSSLTALRAKLKLIQREHKASAKELQSVRQTIKSLQTVKL